jgi:hypothetical protein
MNWRQLLPYLVAQFGNIQVVGFSEAVLQFRTDTISKKMLDEKKENASESPISQNRLGRQKMNWVFPVLHHFRHL